MHTLFELRFQYDGRALHASYQIPSGAHALGVTPKEWCTSYRIPEANLVDYGVQIVKNQLILAQAQLERELRAAWETEPLF